MLVEKEKEEREGRRGKTRSARVTPSEYRRAAYSIIHRGAIAAQSHAGKREEKEGGGSKRGTSSHKHGIRKNVQNNLNPLCRPALFRHYLYHLTNELRANAGLRRQDANREEKKGEGKGEGRRKREGKTDKRSRFYCVIRFSDVFADHCSSPHVFSDALTTRERDIH